MKKTSKRDADAQTQLIELRKLARNNAPTVIRRLMLLARKAQPAEAIRASALLLEWGFGKPENAVEVTGAPVDFEALDASERAKVFQEAADKARAEAVTEIEVPKLDS